MVFWDLLTAGTDQKYCVNLACVERGNHMKMFATKGQIYKIGTNCGNKFYKRKYFVVVVGVIV